MLSCLQSPAIGERAEDESFLQTVDMQDVLACREKGAPDIVAAGIACLQARIKRLAEFIQTGQIEV